MFVRNKNRCWNLLHIITATLDNQNVILDKGGPNPEIVHFDTPEHAELFVSDIAKTKLQIVNHIEVKAPSFLGGKK